MAFEEEGFCVVRGPDLLWGGDIRRFHPPARKFDGVIGGPPCQMFSVMRYINPLAGAKQGNLIPEFERIVMEAQPGWFLMENVRDAPLPRTAGYSTQDALIRDVWVGGTTLRQRRFTFGRLTVVVMRNSVGFVPQPVALHTQEPEVSALAGNNSTVPVVLQRDGHGGHKLKKRHANTGPRSALWNGTQNFGAKLAAQGLPANFLAEAPFTASGKSHAVGNGVPLPMGRAVARAVKRALGIECPARPAS
jgi:DNA (cytosine-5)-methyltransferase 1